MTTCNCPNPPGGRGRCGSNQIAICRTDGVNCYVTCVDPPRNLLKKTKLGKVKESDIFNFISKEVGRDYEPVKAVRRGIIETGTLVNKNNREIIKFRLPDAATAIKRSR